jgi:hypothetical protein
MNSGGELLLTHAGRGSFQTATCMCNAISVAGSGNGDDLFRSGHVVGIVGKG